MCVWRSFWHDLCAAWRPTDTDWADEVAAALEDLYRGVDAP